MSPVEELSEVEACNAAANEDTSAALLATLARYRSTYVRRAVAYNRHCSAETLSVLAADDVYEVRCAVASNQTTPPAAFWTLSADPHCRSVIAGNPNAPRELLSIMAKEAWAQPGYDFDLDPIAGKFRDDTSLLHNIGKNRNTSVDVLNLLLNDHPTGVWSDVGVRTGVAANRSASPAVLLSLAKDPSDEVRLALARNPSAPLEATKILSEDQDPAIRETNSYR